MHTSTHARTHTHTNIYISEVFVNDRITLTKLTEKFENNENFNEKNVNEIITEICSH